MTVAELIAALEKFDGTATVFVNGHPDGGGLDETLDVEDAGWWKYQGYLCSYAGSHIPAQADEQGAVKAVRIY